jgi:hypothetical protein
MYCNSSLKQVAIKIRQCETVQKFLNYLVSKHTFRLDGESKSALRAR